MLLAGIHAASWWTIDGPTLFAHQALKHCALSHGEMVMLRLCWDVWSSEGGVFLTELDVLDAGNRRTVLSLFLAVNESAEHIDMWIDTQAARLGVDEQGRVIDDRPKVKRRGGDGARARAMRALKLVKETT